MVRYASLSAVIGLAALATFLLANEKGADAKGSVAEKFTGPEGYLKSFPTGSELKPVQPKSEALRTAGFFAWYNNVGVNLFTTLLGTDGTTQISVFANDIRWRYAFGNAPDVTSPTGDGGSGGGGWTFPNAHRFGIVVFQGGNYWNVESTDPNNPTVITGLSNTQPIQVTVNDTNGNYGDNSGAFDIYIRKDN
jgi:hypothetical protein